VAREVPELSDKALQRAEAALASRKTPKAFDRTAARGELDELIGRAGTSV
jgi:beta-N-acetylhexosaminidase